MNGKLISSSTSAKTDSGAPVLVVVPCGRSKIWDRNPDLGPIATEAYTWTPFRLNRQYAECFGAAWVVV